MTKNKKMAISILIINIVVFIVLILIPKIKLKHMKIINPLGLLIIIIVFFIPSYLAFWYFARDKKLKEKIKLYALDILVFGFSFMSAAILTVYPIIISETTNIKDYMIVDSYADKEPLKLFPKDIYSSAKDVEYYYRYRVYLEGNYDIYLQYKLSEEDYNTEKDRIASYAGQIEIVKNEMDNDFVDYKFFYDGKRYYAFVSFSDKDLIIKYNASHYYYLGNQKPYFLEHEKFSNKN